MSFAEIHGYVIRGSGGDPYREGLNPTRKRSLQRSLKALVDRGDVVIVEGTGGQLDPYCYTTAEAFAASAKKTGKGTLHTAQEWDEFGKAVAEMGQLR